MLMYLAQPVHENTTLLVLIPAYCLQAGIPVGGVMGTSAGALSGSLYAAGYSPREVRHHQHKQPMKSANADSLLYEV